MNKEKMFNRFLGKIYDSVKDEYTLETTLEDFSNTNNKVILKHTKCGSIFSMQGKRFIAGDRCPKCANEKRRIKKSLSEDTIRERVESVHPELTYLGGFINVNSKIHVKCKVCSFEFNPVPVNLLRKNNPTGCPKCNKNPRKDSEYFKEEIFNLVGDEYELLSNYKNNYTHVLMKHNICNKTYQVKPSVFLNGRRCPVCNGGVRLSQEEAEKKISEQSSGEYILVSEYINNNTPVKIKHLKCSHEYQTRTRDFLNGFGRCPLCNETRGEAEVRKYLEEKGYQFIYQYKLKNFSKTMSFDFFDVDNNILIEYDGEFHYIPFSEDSIPDFIKQKYRDNKKDEYCAKNDIVLLRIPFWLFSDISDILDMFYETQDIKKLKEKYNFNFEDLDKEYIKKLINKRNINEELLFNLNDYRKDNESE